MSTTHLYFSGDIELSGPFPMKRATVQAKFPGIRAKAYDGFSFMVGTRVGEPIHSDWLPVTRVIAYKTNGSKHVCDARCRCAKGGNCECSCGGRFHGIDR